MTDIMIEQILNHIKDYTGNIDELCEKTINDADAKGDEFELPIERYAAFNTQVYYSEKESYIIVSHLQYCLLDLIMNNVDVSLELLKLRYINLLTNIMETKEVTPNSLINCYGDDYFRNLQWLYEYTNKPIYLIMYDNFSKELNIVIDMQNLMQEETK